MNNQPIMKIEEDGFKRWYIDGILHREDGPAVESTIYIDQPYPQFKCWLINGKCHRIDGPAIEHPSGRKEWWINDKRHREDGPAVIDWNGDKEWWIHGINIINIKFIFKQFMAFDNE